MNDKSLQEINNLKKEIDELKNFIFAGNTLSIKIGKKTILKRPRTFSKEEYIVSKELAIEIESILTEHLYKLRKEFENK